MFVCIFDTDPSVYHRGGPRRCPVCFRTKHLVDTWLERATSQLFDLVYFEPSQCGEQQHWGPDALAYSAENEAGFSKFPKSFLDELDYWSTVNAWQAAVVVTGVLPAAPGLNRSTPSSLE